MLLPVLLAASARPVVLFPAAVLLASERQLRRAPTLAAMLAGARGVGRRAGCGATWGVGASVGAAAPGYALGLAGFLALVGLDAF